MVRTVGWVERKEWLTNWMVGAISEYQIGHLSKNACVRWIRIRIRLLGICAQTLTLKLYLKAKLVKIRLMSVFAAIRVHLPWSFATGGR